MLPQVYDQEAWRSLHEYQSERKHAEALSKASASAEAARTPVVETKAKAECGIAKKHDPVNPREERLQKRELHLARSKSLNRDRPVPEATSRSLAQQFHKHRLRPADLQLRHSAYLDSPEANSPFPDTESSVNFDEMVEITSIHSSGFMSDVRSEECLRGKEQVAYESHGYRLPGAIVPMTAPLPRTTRLDPRFGSTSSLESTSQPPVGNSETLDASTKKKKWGLFKSKKDKDLIDVDDKKHKPDLPTKSPKVLKKGKEKALTPRDVPLSAKDFEKENAGGVYPAPALTAEELGKVNAYFLPSPKIVPSLVNKLTPSPNVHEHAHRVSSKLLVHTLSEEQLAEVSVHYQAKASTTTMPRNHGQVVDNGHDSSASPSIGGPASVQREAVSAESSAVHHGPKHYLPGTPITFPILRNPPWHKPDVPVDVDQFDELDDLGGGGEDDEGPIFFTVDSDWDLSNLKGEEGEDGVEVVLVFLDGDPCAEEFGVEVELGVPSHLRNRRCAGLGSDKLRVARDESSRSALPKTFVRPVPIDEMTDDDLDCQ